MDTNNNRVFLFALAVVTLLGLFWFGSQRQGPGNLEKVTVGYQPSISAALLMVAKDKGFFTKHGLDVQMQEFTAGKFALNAFLGGSLDFCMSGDVPPLLAALQGNKFVVPAQVVRKTQNEVRVVARKDGNLNLAKDYFGTKKRKLATSIGGGPEFFTYEFLNKLGIKKDQIEIISQKPEDMVASLVNGSVDAIAIFDPVSYVAEKQMGGRSITFTDSSIYSELYVIEARQTVGANPEKLDKFLGALIDAEKYTKANPDEAKKIIVKYTKLDRSVIDGIWGNYDLSLALTPQLLDVWGREAAWAKETENIPSSNSIPDFKDYIFSGPLKLLNSGAVTI